MCHPGMSATTLAGPAAGLRRALDGQVWLPGDAEFDQARRPWNLAIDQSVVAVAEARDADDVAALVRFAAKAGLGIATQPNGHGATGRTEGAILLRTRRLDRIELDPAARRARVGAGVRSGDLQATAAQHGLTGLPGSSPVVSVAGVALGGGVSWFGRAFGWVADSVTAFDIVDAEGRQRHVTETTDPDLFWALRGGGGDYAIVTALELALHKAPTLYGGRVLWSGEHAAAVLDAYRGITRDAPNELTTWFDLLHFPGADPMVAVDVTYLGDEGPARDLLAPLDRLPAPLSDSRQPMTVAQLGAITAEPTDPSPGKSRCELLTRLDDDAAATLLAEPIAPLLSVQLRHLGGAFAQPSDTPQGPLTDPYLLYLFGLPLDPDLTARVIERQGALAAALPVTGRKPMTVLSSNESLADAIPPASMDRLRRIKAEQDPAGRFRSNFGVLGN